MISNTKRGNYYKNKSKVFYESLGYHVVLTEFNYAVVAKGRVFYKKFDLLGADGIAMNKTDIIFWNSKSTVTSRVKREIEEASKDFDKYPFPPQVKLHAIIWEPRKKPTIIDVRTKEVVPCG
jgi:hypothetical protein